MATLPLAPRVAGAAAAPSRLLTPIALRPCLPRPQRHLSGVPAIRPAIAPAAAATVTAAARAPRGRLTTRTAAAAAGAAAAPEPLPGAGDAAAAAAAADAARAVFWPKVAALATIFLGSTVAYTILQNLRDAVIVTSCGAEALPFLNAFLVLPASVLFFVYYDRLVSRLGARAPRAVFPLALAPLAGFFALFAAVLLPNAHALHPVEAAAALAAALPDSLACLVRVAANWT